jgi:hypothetical protein
MRMSEDGFKDTLRRSAEVRAAVNPPVMPMPVLMSSPVDGGLTSVTRAGVGGMGGAGGRARAGGGQYPRGVGPRRGGR